MQRDTQQAPVLAARHGAAEIEDELASTIALTKHAAILLRDEKRIAVGDDLEGTVESSDDRNEFDCRCQKRKRKRQEKRAEGQTHVMDTYAARRVSPRATRRAR